MNKNLPMKEMVPIIEEVISTGGEFRLFPRGTSMLPLIVEDRDSVVLTTPDNLEKDDVVFYKRKTGQFVLHRIVKIKNNFYYMCGDNQDWYEKDIEINQIIAKVKRFDINGEWLDKNSEAYKKYLRTLKTKRFFKVYRSKLKRAPSYIRRKVNGEK